MSFSSVLGVTRLLLVLLLLVPTRALAAGTGGVEVSPYPGIVDGSQVTAFHVTVPSSVRYSLRNTTSSQRTARLYAASATPAAAGGWTIGDAGSSPYVSFESRTVTLKPREARLETFDVRGDLSERRMAAIVVEVTQGAVTQRAATLVYLSPGSSVSRPLLVVLIAAGLLLLVGGALLWTRRRSRPAGA